MGLVVSTGPAAVKDIFVGDALAPGDECGAFEAGGCLGGVC